MFDVKDFTDDQLHDVLRYAVKYFLSLKIKDFLDLEVNSKVSKFSFVYGFVFAFLISDKVFTIPVETLSDSLEYIKKLIYLEVKNYEKI